MMNTLGSLAFILTVSACLTWQVYGAGESCDITNVRQSSGLDQCLGELATEANVVDSQLVPSGSQFQVYMDLVFRTQEDVFPYCCDAFHAPAATYRLNPLSGDNPPNFQLRDAPSAQFFIRNGASVAVGDNNFYMIAVFDIGTPGQPWVHWMRGNIRGLDLVGSGVDWYSYLNLVVPVHHMFVLYKQGREFTGTIINYGAPNDGQFCIEYRCDFDIERLVRDNNMQLLAASWVEPTRTEYIRYSQLNKLGLPLSTVCTDQVDPDIVIQGNQVICPASSCELDQIQNDQGLQECLDLVTSAISRHAENYFSMSDNLQVYMEGTFRVQEFEVSACCQTEHFQADYFHLKPLESGRPPTSSMLNAPEMHFYPLSSSGIAEDDGRLYSMIMIDVIPDTNGQFSTPTRPYLHWLVVNIPGLRVESGDILFPYFPSGGFSRTYVFILYLQSSVLPASISDFASFFAQPSECFPGTPYACRFDITSFITRYNMEKLGVMWIYPRETLFSAYNVPRVMGEIVTPIACAALGLSLDCKSSSCEGGRDMDVDVCLQAIEEEGAKIIPQALPAAEPLTVYPELTFTTQDRTIYDCCLNKNIRGERLVHNPLDGKEHLTLNYHAVPSLSIRGSVPSGFLTLLMMDNTFVHWAVVNIKDGQLSSGDEFRSLFYPAVGNVHSVLLLQQNFPITSSQFESYSDSSRCPPPPAFSGRCGFNWPKFVNDFDMKLIGANWIHPKRTNVTQMVNLRENWGQSQEELCPQQTGGRVQAQGGRLQCPGQTCSDSVVRSGNLAQCLESVYQAGSKMSAFVAAVDDLPVYLNVRYNNDPFTFDLCCQKYYINSKQVTLNPLSLSQHPEGFYLSQPPNIDFLVPPQQSQNLDVSKTSNDYYLLILADVQGNLPTNEMWSQDLPFIHWMVTNMVAMELFQGEVVVPYMPPTAPSKHMFMLFNQNRAKLDINLAYYAGPDCYPSDKVEFRCNFNLPQLILDRDLKLVGISPVKPGPSRYMDWSIINNLGFNPADICDPNDSAVNIRNGEVLCSTEPPVESKATHNLVGSFGLWLVGIVINWYF